MHVIAMGVSGAGKTVVGRAIAERLGRRFIESDDFHPPANVEKMRAGIPLDDADRRPWLLAIADELARARARGEDVVVACSALKRGYRDLLDRGGDALFVHLAGERDLIERRMRSRSGHFMPPGLLASQFEDLEPPAAGETAITVDVRESPASIADRVVEAVRRLEARDG